MKNKSVLWSISDDFFQKVINESSTYKEILLKLGLDSLSGGNYITLKKRISKSSFDLSGLNLRRKRFFAQHSKQNKKFPFEEIFVKQSKFNNSRSIKRILIEKKGFENKCSKCGVGNNWNGEILVLQLDHIDGNNRNNLIENLRLICPNCHSQTSTFSGRTKKKTDLMKKIDKEVLMKLLEENTIGKVSKILSANTSVIRKLISYYKIMYKKKDSGNHKKKFDTDAETLRTLVNSKPITEIGKMFRVSDNAIRKRCRSLGVTIPKRELGFWSKVHAGKELI